MPQLVLPPEVRLPVRQMIPRVRRHGNDIEAIIDAMPDEGWMADSGQPGERDRTKQVPKLETAVIADDRGHDTGPPTLSEIKRWWPPTVDVSRAALAFGLSRSHAYDLINRGEFPAKVIKVGSRYRVITESVVRALSDDLA